jgi:rod shape determining protein RodA
LTLLFVKWFIAAGIIVVALLFLWIMPKGTRRSGDTKATFLVAGLMIGVVFGVDFFINNVLQKHQRSRVMVLIDPDSDPRGAGWNVIQSKIAIGSGRLTGKGFLEGTQTKFDFVPEQSTDFIFCTVGEEHGFIGSLIVVCLFVGLIIRLIILAERQRTRFARVYGYCVAGIIFFHFMINIGMTIGLMPVIGIPLPFFSYGGSSLWSFSILLFIFLKIDSQRPFTLSRT